MEPKCGISQGEIELNHFAQPYFLVMFIYDFAGRVRKMYDSKKDSVALRARYIHYGYPLLRIQGQSVFTRRMVRRSVRES